MSFRTTLLFSAATLIAVAAAGCDDDGPTTTTTGTTGTSPGGSGGTGGAGGTGGGSSAFPPAPTLGAQIDRLGRPMVNVALNHTFEADPILANEARDEYNQNNEPAKWEQYRAEIARNLAIIDALDAVCGNQLLAGPTPDPGRYDAHAALLADDRLHLDTSATKCTSYLAVEANALGIMANDDCGGRMLTYDVIDSGYTFLASGKPDAGIGDKVPPSDAALGKTFPYLRQPH